MANKPKIDVYMSNHGRSTKYGKPFGWYEEQLALQGGVCAICGKSPKKNRLHIDHDHGCCPPFKSCGKCVRGVICSKCNHYLTALDDQEWVARASAYLEKYRSHNA